MQIKNNVYANSFFLPNDIFDYHLSHRNFKVYSYLRKCSDKHHQCWPSRKDIAKKCGIKSTTTVDTALKELVEDGLIIKTAKVTHSQQLRKHIICSTNTSVILSRKKYFLKILCAA